jgi:hypothetical protein
VIRRISSSSQFSFTLDKPYLYSALDDVIQQFPAHQAKSRESTTQKRIMAMSQDYCAALPYVIVALVAAISTA